MYILVEPGLELSKLPFLHLVCQPWDVLPGLGIDLCTVCKHWSCEPADTLRSLEGSL